ncbi:hypothetical protein E3N88_12916 [Mikania micrantha]|uniref:CCHC-type domain-containing protein n=1 Tax=Mikania micrantha TaxID=192012 RepID=A0A5N6P9D5_9ASTR|nr:hypothetical protein E3N88_12916 [Mikania micrantha]
MLRIVASSFTLDWTDAAIDLKLSCGNESTINLSASHVLKCSQVATGTPATAVGGRQGVRLLLLRQSALRRDASPSPERLLLLLKLSVSKIRNYGRGRGQGRGFGIGERGHGRGSGRGDKSGFRCYECGAFGHFANECTKWKDKEKEPNLIELEEPALL